MIDRALRLVLPRASTAFFTRASAIYTGGVARVLRVAVAALVLYAGLIGLTVARLRASAAGFVPAQDKDYLVAFAQLPDASTLDRTEAVIRKMSAIALEHPGVASSVAFPGLSINGFVNASNAGIAFVTLKPADGAHSAPELTPTRSCRTLNSQLRRHPGSVRRDLPAAAGAGARQVGGFKLYVEDRGGLGFEELYSQVQGAHRRGPAGCRRWRACSRASR